MRVQTTKVALTLLTFSLTTQAAVDMKAASFQQVAIDGGIISRTYSSRSLHNGVFGFGWCSNIETDYSTDCPGPSIKLKHSVDGLGRVVSLRFLDGTMWRIHYNKESKVRQVSSPRLQLKYEYRDENLVQAGSTNYFYDELHNLIEIEEQQKRDRIQYDPDRDWVLEFKRRDGCTERFSYERTNPLSGPKETAIARIQCGLRIDSVIYEFFYHQHSEGVSLAKVRSTAGNLVKVITLERGI